jgi:hypothetical protein
MSKIRIVLVCLLVACGSSKDPSRRLTERECAAAVDHAIELLAAEPDTRGFADTMRAGHATHVKQCLETATLRDHECLMKARDARELGLCPMPGGGR